MEELLRRGQVGVVTALLLGAIILAGIIAAYSWGVPILQKNQDESMLESSLNRMESLEQTISEIARRGGSEQLSFPVREGSLFVDADEDSIEYSVTTGATYVSTQGWVPLNENEMKGLALANRSGSYGILGRDRPGVIAGRATPQGEDFLTQYSLVFRELYDLQASRGYTVDLVQNGNLQASGGTVDVTVEKGEEETVQGGSATGGPLVRRRVLISIE